GRIANPPLTTETPYDCGGLSTPGNFLGGSFPFLLSFLPWGTAPGSGTPKKSIAILKSGSSSPARTCVNSSLTDDFTKVITWFPSRYWCLKLAVFISQSVWLGGSAARSRSASG